MFYVQPWRFGQSLKAIEVGLKRRGNLMARNLLEETFEFTAEDLINNRGGVLSKSQHHRLFELLRSDYQLRKSSALKVILFSISAGIGAIIISNVHPVSILILLLGLMMIDVEVTKGPNLLKYRSQMRKTLGSPTILLQRHVFKQEFKPTNRDEFYAYPLEPLPMLLNQDQISCLHEGQSYTFYYLILFIGSVEILSVEEM